MSIISFYNFGTEENSRFGVETFARYIIMCSTIQKVCNYSINFLTSAEVLNGNFSTSIKFILRAIYIIYFLYILIIY